MNDKKFEYGVYMKPNGDIFLLLPHKGTQTLQGENKYGYDIDNREIKKYLNNCEYLGPL